MASALPAGIGLGITVWSSDAGRESSSFGKLKMSQIGTTETDETGFVGMQLGLSA